MDTHVQTFDAVLNEYLTDAGMTEREFLARVPLLHPTTFAEVRAGVDPCNAKILLLIVKGLKLDRAWASRFYLALLAGRDGEEMLRAAGLIE